MNFDPKYLSWSAPFFASEDWMREEFGVWQQSIRVLRADEVTISFAEVQWIDPLVLMSLLAESVRAYAKGNIKVLTLDLGRPGFAEHSAFESRTRKYIVQHRWLAAFCKALPDSLRVRYHANESDVRVEVSGTDVAGIQKIERQITSESGSSLLYNSDLLIEPTAIFAADWESAVGDAIQRVDEAYFRRSVERRALRGTTLQRLRAVMRELVRNSIEHAYPPQTPEADLFAFEHRAAPVIIYARTRRGSEAGRSLREDHRPQTTGAILEPSASDQFWIEACVVDVGKGIWTDAPQWASDSSIAKELRRSITKLCRSANPGPGLSNLLWHTNLSKYSRDLESKAVAERGRITGLFYLNSVLSVSSDWSNWYSDRTWRYSVHPVTLTKGQLKQAPDGAVGMQGTCFRICLNVAEFDTTLPPSWFVPSAHPDLMMKVARRLERDAIGSEQAVPFLSRPLLDLRHARERDANDELPVVDFFRVNTANEVVVRVPRAFDKNRFVSCVNAWLATLSTASYSHNTARLIVADVSRAQAKNFELVFGLGTELTKGEWLRLAGHKFPQDSILVVLADDLSCFAVKFQAKQDISAKGEPFCIVKAESYVLSDVSAAVHTTVNAPSLEELLASTLARLRERDSVLFWARVAELQPTADACLWGPVEWHSGGTEPTVLDHYLDFSAAMKDSELSKYLRRSLRRTLALVPGSHLECVDSLVEAEIADAIRWFANNEMFDFGKSGALRISKSRRIVVGSVRVTGATLRMLYRLPGQKPAAVIDCFVQPVASRQSEVDPMHEIPQLSVLSWNPGPIPHAEGIRYEQELGTPYIRRVPAKLRSVVSIDAKPRVGSAQPASDMYRQFVADGLIKIGHWYYGDRHSLLEVDTASAINNFASTHAAQIDEQFFGWLRNVLVDTFRNCPDNGTVAYVPQRLTQSIVRHFKLRNPQLPYRFVPIHLFSGIAGGVDQLSDMTLHALQVARADANGEPCSASVPVVVLDVGFISKRTLRHVRRQLAVAGVKKTVAVGLMNRSSSPAHADEESRQRLYTYWRWNIPVLGRASQCSLCAAIRVYEEFERRTSDAFPDLAVVLTAMKSDWIPAGMADMWRDKGIEPSLLNSPKAVKFGFRTTNRGSKSESPNWEYVEHRFATTLTAHYIELARYTGNGRHLLDAARSDAAIGNAARVFTSESLLEAFATFILACGSTLPFWTRVDYLKELVHTVVSLDAEMRGVSSTSTAIAMTSPRRFEQLIGMSTLALLGLDIRTRVVARDIVFEHLTMMPSTPQFFEASVMDSLQPETRVFFLAGLYPPNSSSGSTAKSQHDADIARMDALSEPRKMEEREFWRSLKLYFGRGPRHRGVAIEEFEDAVSSDDFQAVGVALQAVAVLLLRCPAELLQKVGITNLRESADTETPPVIQVLTEAARAVRHGLSKQGDLVQDARIVLGVVRASFQSHLLRCEAPQGTNEVPRSGVSTVLQAFRADCGLVDQVGYLGEDFEWTATRSMIWCKKTRALIRERLENASRVVSELLTAQQTPEFGEGRALQIGVKEQARGVQLCIENHCAGSAPASGTKAVPTFLDAIGGGVTWQTRAQSSTMHWYSVTITVPWIEAIEISN